MRLKSRNVRELFSMPKLFPALKFQRAGLLGANKARSVLSLEALKEYVRFHLVMGDYPLQFDIIYDKEN